MTTTLGVLMLETRFERLPGDIGNPESWPGKVLFHVVPGADLSRVVLKPEVDPTLLAPYLEGARALEEEGARLITTSCGFLSVFQEALADAVTVPVLASSLMLAPLLARCYGRGRALGIITANSAALGPHHLAAAGMTTPVIIGGIEGGCELPRAILRPLAEQTTRMDFDRAERDVLEAGAEMLARAPEIFAFLLECTNLQPYAPALCAATGRPVYGLLDALRLCAPPNTRIKKLH